MNKRKRQTADLPLLKTLARLEGDERDALLRSINHKNCESIFDCVFNCLRNKSLNPELRQEAKARLRGKEKKLRLLLDNKAPTTKKHKALIQVGGNDIGWILKNIVPLLEEHLKQ